MKAAMATTTAISQGLAAGRQGAAREAGVAPAPRELSTCPSVEFGCPAKQTPAPTRHSQQVG